MNVDKRIYKINNITPEQLKKIFEISLRGQYKGVANSDFFEFSDNLKIERYDCKEEEKEKVKQIYINADGDFKPLFEENGNVAQEFKNRTFSVATCEYIATGGRPSLNFFKELKDKEVVYNDPICKKSEKMTRQIFTEAIKQAVQDNLEKAPEVSVIQTVHD